MSDFRIFCELLAKTMLESIDFTDVLEGYRRNEKPEKLGIATFVACARCRLLFGRNEKPERLQKRIFEEQEMPTITEQFQFSGCWHFFQLYVVTKKQ